MGWSCRKDAMDSLNKLEELLKGKGEKFQNTFTNKQGVKFFYGVSTNKEYSDGHITGKVFKMINENSCLPFGSFHIAGDGEITRFPGMPKEYIEYVNLTLKNAFVVMP